MYFHCDLGLAVSSFTRWVSFDWVSAMSSGNLSRVGRGRLRMEGIFLIMVKSYYSFSKNVYRESSWIRNAIQWVVVQWKGPAWGLESCIWVLTLIKSVFYPWDTHLAFSLLNKGPQSFLLTPRLEASQCSIFTLFIWSLCQTAGVHSCFYHWLTGWSWARFSLSLRPPLLFENGVLHWYPFQRIPEG